MNNIYKTGGQLYVCWKYPQNIIKKDTKVLSFLDPAEEYKLKKIYEDNIISARKTSQLIRDEAIKIYFCLTSKIASTLNKNGRSLRQELINREGFSWWWLNGFCTRNCESDPTFNLIIQILTIKYEAERLNCRNLVMVGGFKEISIALAQDFIIRDISPKRIYCNVFFLFFKGLLARIYGLIKFIQGWVAVKAYLSKRAVDKKPEVLFFGFWDWSIKEDKKSGKLSDRYFKLLPGILSSNNVSIGWLLWFDPDYESGQKGRNLGEVLKPLKKNENMFVLQNYIGFADIISAFFNYKPLISFSRYLRADKGFDGLFVIDKINFRHIAFPQMYYGFSDAMIARLELMFLASKRAMSILKPKLSLNFLEFFMSSKAFYLGSKKGSPETINYAVQHASYSREKTFGLMDKEREFNGFPDNCIVPKPDSIFAMGELGRNIFIEDGYLPKQVYPTGSTRYDCSVKVDQKDEQKDKHILRILIAITLNSKLEMETVKAVYEAVKEMSQIKVLLRDHPFGKITEQEDFYTVSDRIELSKNSLEQDLKNSDLVIFTYSTVAEEVIIRGIPAWQWLTCAFNGSVFRDLKVIPSFSTVQQLRDSLKLFIEKPSSFMPDQKTKDLVLKNCFYSADGKAAQRISEVLLNKLKAI